MSLKKYRIVVPHEVLEQIERIHRYISQELNFPENAAVVSLRIWNAIDSLETLPERHAYYRGEYRRVNAGNYAVLYKVSGDTVYIEAVLYQHMCF